MYFVKIFAGYCLGLVVLLTLAVTFGFGLLFFYTLREQHVLGPRIAMVEAMVAIGVLLVAGLILWGCFKGFMALCASSDSGQ